MKYGYRKNSHSLHVQYKKFKIKNIVNQYISHIIHYSLIQTTLSTALRQGKHTSAPQDVS